MTEYENDKFRLCRSIPEYDRHLKKLVISLSAKDTTLAMHHEILQRLPDYAEIIILLPKNNVSAIQSQLRTQPYGRRSRLVTYETLPREGARFFLLFPECDKLMQVDTGSCVINQQGTLWAQDLFEVTTSPAGLPVLLTSVIHKYYYASGDQPDFRVSRDNLFIENLASVGIEVLPLPLAFEGGNILVDNFDGKRIAFCGGDIIRTTKTVWRAATEEEITRQQLIGVLKKTLNVDTVVVIGEDFLQPSQMYHLDQAMILLSGGVAGVARIVADVASTDSESETVLQSKRFLSELRGTLSALGYRIVDIEISVDNLMNCRHYVNSIPYIDAETNQRKLLMPVFLSAQSPDDRSIVARNTRTFESLGYTVVHIPTSVDGIRGGIHCLVNVLE